MFFKIYFFGFLFYFVGKGIRESWEVYVYLFSSGCRGISLEVFFYGILWFFFVIFEIVGGCCGGIRFFEIGGEDWGEVFLVLLK